MGFPYLRQTKARKESASFARLKFPLLHLDFPPRPKFNSPFPQQDSLDHNPASILGLIAVGDPDGDDVCWLRLTSRLSSRNLSSSLVFLEICEVLESRPRGTVFERNESGVVVRRSLGEDSDELRVVES